MKTTISLSARKDYSSIDVGTVLAPWNQQYWAEGVRAYAPDSAPNGLKWSDADTKRPQKAAWKTVVFLTYENPKGASGGILSVMRRLPAELAKRFPQRDPSKTPRQFIRLSPHHTNLRTKYAPADLKEVARCQVKFGPPPAIEVIVSKVTPSEGEDWYVFGAKGFFEADGGFGGTDPYTWSTEDQAKRDHGESLLLRDSLFAAKAVPAILAALDWTRDVIVHAQDWEFACAALTVKEALLAGTLESAAVVLTLHNPYDHGVSAEKLSLITEFNEEAFWPPIGGMERPTVLTKMIPLLDAPVSVVSHQFAHELVSSPIQTGVFTRHLLPVLKHQGLVGIDNGDFRKATASPPFSPKAIASAKKGDFDLIWREKAAKRKTMLSALAEYQRKIRPEAEETWTMGKLMGLDGRRLEELPDNIPVFMMVGRLDPGQKGYDVCAQLIHSLPPGAARFILTPMSPLAKDAAVRPYFQQLNRLAEERPGDVVIFSHRMEPKVYTETMAGTTFGLWPSRYEPFGGANEFYASGTPVIAHAVGGLVQQVIDYNMSPEQATGFLYHDVPGGRFQADLETEFRAAHDTLLPENRMEIPEYVFECELLENTVHHAIDVFRFGHAAYATMLANLPDVLAQLSWDKPVDDYLAWYETACHKG